MMVMIYEDDQVTVSFDENVPCIVWCPEGFLKGDKFRLPFDKGLDFMERNIGSYPNMTWLNDARKLKTVGLDDVQWLNKHVNERAKKFGAKRVAFVLPENVFGRWAVKMYVEFTNKVGDSTLDIRAFKSIDDAKKWLKAEVDQIESVTF